MQLHGAPRHGRGNRRRGGLPGLARREFDDGRRARRRWGVHRPMIVHPVGDTAEIVMQVDHSHRRGATLASLWPGLEPRESVLTAATLHDIGWRSWEACPRLDAETGRPQNFLSVDIDLHLEFYEAGIAEVTARDRYAGMLVGKHLAGIYRQRYGTQAALELTRAPEAQAMVDEFVGARRGALPGAAARARRLRRRVLAQLRAAAGLRPALAVALQGRPRRHGEHADRPARTTASSRSRRPPSGCALQPVSVRERAGGDLRARARRAADRLRERRRLRRAHPGGAGRAARLHASRRLAV